MGHHQAKAIQLALGSESAACPGCASRRFIQSPSREEKFGLAVCPKCGTALTFPRPETGELEARYDSSYYGPGNVKFVSPVEKLVEWMNRRRSSLFHRQLRLPGKVLEIGCGRGLILKQLSRLGHECYGIERSPLAASRASQIPNVNISTQALEDCGFLPSSFDLVILWHVLEHLEEPRKTLNQICDMLKPGGTLVLEVPNLSSWQARVFGKNWFHLDIPRHLFHFSREGLTLLLEANQFTISEVSTFSTEQGPFGALQSTLNCLISPTNGLYSILKRETQTSSWKKLVYIVLGVVLSPVAALFAGIEATAGRGAVLRVTARKAS